MISIDQIVKYDLRVKMWNFILRFKKIVFKNSLYNKFILSMIYCGQYSNVKTCMKACHPVCATNGHTYCSNLFFVCVWVVHSGKQ